MWNHPLFINLKCDDEGRKGGDNIKSLFLITLYYKTIKVLQLKLKKWKQQQKQQKQQQ